MGIQTHDLRIAVLLKFVVCGLDTDISNHGPSLFCTIGIAKSAQV